MINRKMLLDDLKKLLPKLEADLLERSESGEVPDVGAKLREEYAEAQAASRTAQSFTDWRSDAITQHAAAWVLSLVFVRFLEDNGLINTPAIAGPGDRLTRARDEHEVYFRTHPTQTDRDYLLALFDDLTKPAATRDVFGAHNPIRDLPNWLSGDAARTCLEFFQRIDPNTGLLVHDFTDLTWDTRFLGDLYEDLSEAARKKYALLQTPVFVEEFILDRTLDPALEEFGLAKPGYDQRVDRYGRLNEGDCFKMIDPACGSGHFLLGSFARLLDRWRKKEPGTKAVVLVQRALDGVHGVDANPYAIAIARFRLLLAALKECGVTRLTDAPGFEIQLACGDSLLHGSPGGDQETMGWAPTDHVYQPENRSALGRLLRPKSYQAVVANPPYITPKDSALNTAYRDRYVTCHRQYSLAVPFLERIFSLATESGFTGQITANSFMKREFGKKLIESYLPRIDLTQVIDTSGAHIPGHGTPTVLIFGRNRKPVSRLVRAVLGIEGEIVRPEIPSEGPVWKSIVDNLDVPSFENRYITVKDISRDVLSIHPWSLAGGGASELRDLIETSNTMRLGDLSSSIGYYLDAHEDEAFMQPVEFPRRHGLSHGFREHVRGENIRDWSYSCVESIAFPYDSTFRLWSEIPEEATWAWFHQLRTTLWSRSVFGGGTYRSAGRAWFEFHQFPKDRASSTTAIVYGFFATHNHFALNRSAVAFSRSAPVILLSDDVDQRDYLAVLGILNSSVMCFWSKQVFHDKGGGGIGGGLASEKWERFYEYTGTLLQRFPLPSVRPNQLASELDSLAQRLADLTPGAAIRRWQEQSKTKPFSDNPLSQCIVHAQIASSRILGQMILLQEELDWQCYRLYGLIEEDLTLRRTDLEGLDALSDPASPHEMPNLKLGQRAFEIALARKLAAGVVETTWFDRHGSVPITAPPSDWPNYYRQLVERRIALIEAEPNITLIEQPEYKRRWNTEPWAEQRTRALWAWLLDRLESYFDVDGRINDAGTPTARLEMGLTTVGRLADVARQDPEFLQVGELYRDDPAFDVSRLVAELVEGESVPLLPILRYKASGLLKRAEWETTWALQRQEDAIDARAKLPKDHPDFLTELEAGALKKKQVGTIPVPPKYASADFLKGDSWRLRGKLDVPKERWVSFPHCEGEDGTALVAWAGYDHLQLARAISTFYVDVQERLGGRDDPRLVPLLAGLIELLPWLKQWHNEVDPEFGVPMGDYFEGFVQEESRNLGLTLDEIKAWTPPSRGRSRRGGRRSARSNEGGE